MNNTILMTSNDDDDDDEYFMNSAEPFSLWSERSWTFKCPV